MMNTLFRGAPGHALKAPITSFTYRDMSTPHGKEWKPAGMGAEREGEQASSATSAQELKDLVSRARMEAVAETEARLKREYEARSEADATKVRQALELFQEQRKSYFSRVEAEVVKLSLAIATKILHRQVQVDPMLVAALVRVAVDKLHDGSRVTVRVSPAEAFKWRQYLANPLNGSKIEIVEDSHLGPEDCILETDLGSANFSIDAQMKEVEQGFFDLLAQRPAIN